VMIINSSGFIVMMFLCGIAVAGAKHGYHSCCSR
jgi:hypothetical protein